MDERKSPLVNWLALVRWPNALMVMGILWLVRWGITLPIAGENALPWPLYLMLSLGMAALTAAGNIYNDLQDLEADAINKPHRPLASGAIGADQARNGFYAAAAASIALSAWPAWHIDQLRLLFFPAFGLLMLVKYAEDFKGRPLLGNLIIAFMSGMVVLMPAFFDLLPLESVEGAPYRQSALQVMIAYASFSFFTTLSRELVKTLEDVPGDLQQGYRTAAVAWGTLLTRMLAVVAVVPAMTGLFGLGYVFAATSPWASAMAFGLALGLLIYGGLVIAIQTTPQASRASAMIKGIMVAGLISMVLLALPAYL
jgi:4-hydroxybenzoate polyprenyltransferase